MNADPQWKHLIPRMANKRDKNMPEESHHVRFITRIKRKADRRSRARSSKSSVWFGLGMLGMVGWSVGIPTLIGTLVGVWIDKRWDLGFSATLTGILLGVGLGCWNAWFWVKRQDDHKDTK